MRLPDDYWLPASSGEKLSANGRYRIRFAGRTPTGLLESAVDAFPLELVEVSTNTVLGTFLGGGVLPYGHEGCPPDPRDVVARLIEEHEVTDD